ncbi:MAG TPA: DNA gyrase inhibitor YacG [Lacipirellulaceae bacterium]|nr:DNA gyrase inhibitor YacG [Lacipirellulaceae bacterium]
MRSVQYESLLPPPSLLLMRCPICNREFERESSTAMPFCSERCRTIDLGRWLGENYQLPVVTHPEADEVPDQPPGPRGNGAVDAAD